MKQIARAKYMFKSKKEPLHGKAFKAKLTKNPIFYKIK